MLHIIWLILKIAGILLLALAVILILLLLIVMFAPFHYKGAFKREKNGEEMLMEAAGEVTWLFHLLHARVSYSNERRLNAHLRILWFHILDKPETDQKEEEKESFFDEDVFSLEEEEDRNTLQNSQTKDAAGRKQELGENGTGQSKGKAPNPEDGKGPVGTGGRAGYAVEAPVRSTDPDDVLTSKDPNEKAGRKAEKKVQTVSGKKKISIAERIKKACLKLYERLCVWWKRVRDQYRRLTKKKDRLFRFLQAPHTKASWRLIRRALRSLFKHIRPRKLQGYIHIGRDDPEEMGKILGIAALFYPLYGKELEVIPEFDREILEGHIRFKGHIQMYIFIVWAVRIFFDKQIRKTLRHFKKLKEDF